MSKKVGLRKRLRRFFLRHWLGRLLVFLSLPAFLLVVLFWPKTIDPPLVDVQMHYNQEAWRHFNARAVIGTMRELAVNQAVVSSTPNQGTFKLLDEAPQFVIPMFQPYRTRDDRDNWFENPEILALFDRELRNWNYRGIGELHIRDGTVDAPVVQRVLQLAAEQNLVLNIHAFAPTLRELYKREPRIRVLWAHAGMTATPDQINEMLERYPTLRAELSHRLDVAPRGELDPAWRALFLRHPDRFMIGSGTYNNEFWYQFRYTMGWFREWLAQLPPDIAERIAWRNAVELFGGTAVARPAQIDQNR